MFGLNGMIVLDDGHQKFRVHWWVLLGVCLGLFFLGWFTTAHILLPLFAAAKDRPCAAACAGIA